PSHLYSNDFFLLGQATDTFDFATSSLNLNNPLHRDITSLSGGVYLVLAFKTDNPRPWLIHYHMAWHASEWLTF
ncbi:multicopper oxidase, partial [Rhexocercosporidium sp. MPI-PUGE-AT-0058]